MLRSIAIAAALVVTALPAAAASVTVNIAGLDAAQAHAKIEKAAADACTIALRDDTQLDQYYGHADCIDDAVAAAEAKLAEGNRKLAKL